jgi:5-methylcytosine-specific restriction endonuclease McrA
MQKTKTQNKPLRRTIFLKRISPARKKKIVKQTKRDKEFYIEIWDSRLHICGCCLNPLPDEPRLFNFDHILPKASFKKLRYEKDNIALTCWECHQIKTSGKLTPAMKSIIHQAVECFVKQGKLRVIGEANTERLKDWIKEA